MIIVREKDLEAAVDAVIECASHATNAQYLHIKLPMDRSLVRKSVLAMISIVFTPSVKSNSAENSPAKFVGIFCPFIII